MKIKENSMNSPKYNSTPLQNNSNVLIILSIFDYTQLVIFKGFNRILKQQQYLMLDWLFGRRKQQPPAKPKPSAEQQAEDKWKYDFLIQFLSGPLWKTSILDFVDYHCVVFDNEQENKFEYTTIHNKFKQLVGNLVDGMVQEVGLDDDKLAQLLQKGFQSKHKKVFNQLLLADDFLRFKTLMLNRNKALQAEAIKALTEKSNIVEKPNKKVLSNEQQLINESKKIEQQRRRQQLQQEEQLRKVLELSKLQAQEQDIIKRMEVQVEQNQIRQSQKSQQSPVVQKNKSPVVKKQTQVVQKSNEPIAAKQPPKVSESLILPPVRRRRKVEDSPKVEQKVEEKKQEKQEVLPPPPPPQVPVVVEQKQAVAQQQQIQSQQERKRRLLQQRQKIRKRKEEQRKKQMAQEEVKHSPQVNTIVLQEDGIHDTQYRAPEEEKKEKVNNEEIQRRRQLMRKIKNRIVDDF